MVYASAVADCTSVYYFCVVWVKRTPCSKLLRMCGHRTFGSLSRMNVLNQLSGSLNL